MEATWNTSRTSQNFQTRTRQWRTPLCAKRRTKSASSSMFLRAAFIALFAFPVFAKASEQDLTSKGHEDDGPLVPSGPDEETLVDEGADGRGDFDGGVVPADGVDTIQLLQDLAESGEKDIGGGRGGGGGRTKMAAKRKWSNNEYLRVWGKRNDALRKLSNQDSARDSFQKELLRDRSDRPSRDAAVLVLLGGMRGRPGDGDRGRSPSGLAQLEEEVAGKSGSAGFQVIDAREFEPRILGMGTGIIPRPDEAREKRKWERNSLRIWGKRDEANPGSSSSSLSDYTNMRRRKWENLPLRVWGK